MRSLFAIVAALPYAELRAFLRSQVWFVPGAINPRIDEGVRSGYAVVRIE